MSTAITTEAPAAKASALVVLASRLNVEPDKLHQALKATVCPKSTNEELMAFCIVCNEYGLNPFIKEIYAFPGKAGGIVPMVSIDGWIRIINDHPMLDGIQFSFDTTSSGELISCTCRIHRKDRSHAVEVTEFLSECKRNTEPWKMESRMLRHKALIQCARVAFGFSGIHDEDEAKAISEGPRNVTPQPAGNPFDAKPVTEEPALEVETVEEPPPDRAALVATIKEAYNEESLSMQQAEAKYRAAGLLDKNQTLGHASLEQIQAIANVGRAALQSGFSLEGGAA